MRKLLKSIWLMGLLLLLLLAAACLLPLPKRINATHEGVIWRSGAPEETQPTSVTITGTFWDYLLLEDKFDGSVQVEALPETHKQISIAPLGEGQFGIWYADDETLMKSLGSMFMRKDGSVMVLLHEEGHWDADTGLMLTAPAATRAEAVALANELAQELSPNWLGAWTFE